MAPNQIAVSLVSLSSEWNFCIRRGKILFLWLPLLENFWLFQFLMIYVLQSNDDICAFFIGLELPFMMMPHPLIPVSLPPASVTMAMSQMNHLSTIANMAAAAQVQSPPSRVETSVIKVILFLYNYFGMFILSHHPLIHFSYSISTSEL